MGYTHYWTPTSDPAQPWGLFYVDALELVNLAAGRKIRIGAPDGDGGKPILERGRLAFNGVGPEANEPFDLKRGGGWSCCKTRFQVYDVVVVAALCLAADRGCLLSCSSDGEVDDWSAGLELARAVRPGVGTPKGIRR